jgi:HEAT repeat protein
LEAIAAQRIETELREAAIRALGKIGDPRAVGTLAKIARRRWSMPIKKNRYLRRVVFDSLDGYPKETIRDLLHYGLKQKDDVVRAACKRLLQKGVGKIGNEDGAIE